MAPDTAERVLRAAARVFARYGFEGASVRQICKAAEVNAQAIHYHFGSKDKLYRAVLGRFVEEQNAIVARLVTSQAANLEDLRTRLLFFLDTILEFWLRAPELEMAYMEARRHGPYEALVIEPFVALDGALASLLASSQQVGLVRDDLDLALVAATLTERTAAQAIDAELIESFYGTSARDPETRRVWIGKLIDLILFGIAQPRATGPPEAGD